jgi:hypothetical protein
MRALHDYTALDAAILASIAAGNKQFDAIHAGDVAQAADDLTTNERRTPAFRQVDKRLQSLRKRGKVYFDKSAKAWHLTPAPVPSPTPA